FLPRPPERRAPPTSGRSAVAIDAPRPAAGGLDRRVLPAPLAAVRRSLPRALQPPGIDRLRRSRRSREALRPFAALGGVPVLRRHRQALRLRRRNGGASRRHVGAPLPDRRSRPENPAIASRARRDSLRRAV